MRITRLRIENFRRFRAPVEITGLDAGLNLFAAPNESGKSTIAAAIRAAFLERHKTGSLDALRPWGDATASPAVEIDFEFDGTHYALAKSFLTKKRCDLTIGRARVTGDEADERLADFIGCRLALKGEARPETPILLVEDRTYANTWIMKSKRERHAGSRSAFIRAFDSLVSSGVKNLYYVEGEALLGDDTEGTTDGSHPNDLGFMRQADVLEPVLRKALGLE